MEKRATLSVQVSATCTCYREDLLILIGCCASTTCLIHETHSWQSYLLTIHIYCANISQSQLTNVAATILTSGDQATVARDPSPWRRRCDAEFLSCFHPSGTLQTKQVPLQLWLRKLSGNFYTASTWHRVCGLLKIFGSVSFLKPSNPKSPTKSTFDNLCFSSLFCKEFVVRGVYPKLKRYFAQDGGQVVGASFTLYTIYALRCIGRFFQHFFLLTQPIIRVSISESIRVHAIDNHDMWDFEVWSTVRSGGFESQNKSDLWIIGWSAFHSSVDEDSFVVVDSFAW